MACLAQYLAVLEQHNSQLILLTSREEARHGESSLRIEKDVEVEALLVVDRPKMQLDI